MSVSQEIVNNNEVVVKNKREKVTITPHSHDGIDENKTIDFIEIQPDAYCFEYDQIFEQIPSMYETISDAEIQNSPISKSFKKDKRNELKEVFINEDGLFDVIKKPIRNFDINDFRLNILQEKENKEQEQPKANDSPIIYKELKVREIPKNYYIHKDDEETKQYTDEDFYDLFFAEHDEKQKIYDFLFGLICEDCIDGYIFEKTDFKKMIADITDDLIQYVKQEKQKIENQYQTTKENNTKQQICEIELMLKELKDNSDDEYINEKITEIFSITKRIKDQASFGVAFYEDGLIDIQRFLYNSIIANCFDRFKYVIDSFLDGDEINDDEWQEFLDVYLEKNANKLENKKNTLISLSKKLMKNKYEENGKKTLNC